MDFKKVLIGVAVVGGLYWIYKKSQENKPKSEGTSNASGSQTTVTCTCTDINGVTTGQYSTGCTIAGNYEYDKARCCTGLCSGKGMVYSPSGGRTKATVTRK